MMTEYYKEKLEQGLYFQDYVVELLYKNGIPIISYSSKQYQNMIGENKAGLEIKNDQHFRKTGNLYIETAEKSNAANKEFVPSGIYRNDNTWLYLIGDREKVFVFGKRQLISLHKKNKYRTVETSTSRGFLLPIEDAEKYYSLRELCPDNCTER